MRIAYLDCFAGISGDMLIGALLDLGLDFAALQAELSRLSLPGYRLQAEKVQKGSISATSFKVILEDAQGVRLADSEFSEVKDPGESGGPGALSPVHSHAHGRGLAEILALIQASDCSAAVKQRAAQVFTRLGEAEGRVHGLPPEQVHFHEVGGVDALVDIVGACIGLELLGIEQVYASALHLGGGFVRSAHGLLPVPAPATAELLAGVPVYTTQMSGELVTPTGAAILTTIAFAYGPMPLMTVGRVGYGAGSRDREFPNVLRAMLGETQPLPRQAQPAGRMQFTSTGPSASIPTVNRDPFPEQHDVPAGNSGWHDGAAVVIEANLDDMSPQLFENLLDRLLVGGALDVLLIPAQMKKGRPGMLLQVLAHPDSLDGLLNVIFRESTTIGARTYPAVKHMLQREIRTVHTRYGDVRVKIAYLGDELVNISPEYEDCKQLAVELGRPLKEILSAAMAAARS